MKKVLIASIAAAVLYSAPALAAPPAGVFNWSGFYIGVNGGEMNFSTQAVEPNNVNAGFNTDRKQVALAGLHGGYQGQWGNWIVGVEGAWGAVLSNGPSSRVGDFTGALTCNAVAPDTCNARISDVLSVGPRLGYAMNQWMIYATGGYARAHIESFNLVAGVPFALGDNHHDGWYWGGGLEMLANNAFTIGVEYKHFDFSSALHRGSGATSPLFDRDTKAKADAVLLRLTIKGGG